MGIQLKTVVPWGRCLAEYIKMFNLTEADKAKTILDCGSGPASFTVEMTAQGYQVTACDPIYQFGKAEIKQRIQETYDDILTQVAQHQDSYVWQDIRSPEHLGEVRMQAMQQFLSDFEVGLQAGRYQSESLPTLPFSDQQFDLALSSHFLLLYSTQLGLPFHQAAIQELCRVAREVRIFPLVTVSGERSPWLTDICELLASKGHQTTIETVTYQFQKGGNQMLRITSRSS